MNKLDDFGYVWLASSPLNDNINLVQKAIDAGIDAVVLKSVSPLAKPGTQKIGVRTIKKGVIPNVDQTWFASTEEIPEYKRTMFSTSTHWDIDVLSFEEANELYRKIKKYSPDTNVIQNFSPSKISDLSLVERLEADAIEFNFRQLLMTGSRPYVVWAYNPFEFHGKMPPDGEQIFQNLKQMVKEKDQKVKELKTELAKLRLGVPTLLKMARDFFELDFITQLSLPVDGFSYADTSKCVSFQSRDGYNVQRWGKGSLSGDFIKEDTLMKARLFRGEHKPDGYLSAAGGIMAFRDARNALHFANSVQLCTAVYWYGIPRVRNIVNAVRKHAEEFEVKQIPVFPIPKEMLPYVTARSNT